MIANYFRSHSDVFIRYEIRYTEDFIKITVNNAVYSKNKHTGDYYVESNQIKIPITRREFVKKFALAHKNLIPSPDEVEIFEQLIGIETNTTMERKLATIHSILALYIIYIAYHRTKDFLDEPFLRSSFKFTLTRAQTYYSGSYQRIRNFLMRILSNERITLETLLELGDRIISQPIEQPANNLNLGEIA